MFDVLPCLHCCQRNFSTGTIKQHCIISVKSNACIYGTVCSRKEHLPKVHLFMFTSEKLTTSADLAQVVQVLVTGVRESAWVKIKQAQHKRTDCV